MTQRAKRLIKNPSGYHSHGKTPEEKVHNFALFIKEHGWTGTWQRDEESRILTLKASNGDNEKIDIEWPEGQWWPDVWYSFAGNTIKCRNISHAAKLAQEPPDQDAMRRAASKRKKVALRHSVVGPNRAATGRTESGLPLDLPSPSSGLRSDMCASAEELIESLAVSLPFDKESTQAEVVAVLKRHRNPTITWVNRLTGQVHTGTIKSGGRNNRVTTTKEGKVIITFADPFGFHSVYVRSIIGFS